MPRWRLSKLRTLTGGSTTVPKNGDKPNAKEDSGEGIRAPNIVFE